MKKYTQKELLNEVLWRGIKGLGGAAIRGGAEALRRTLPELTDPIDKLEKGMREVGDEFRAGWHLDRTRSLKHRLQQQVILR